MQYEADVCAIAREAGAAILAVYEGPDFDVQIKSDDSPLTAADLAAHEIIVAGLSRVSDLPILSEESEATPWATRREWSRY